MMEERNVGCAGASFAPSRVSCRGVERDPVNPEGKQTTTLTYSQMLRMSMEDCAEVDMESSFDEAVQESGSCKEAILCANEGVNFMGSTIITEMRSSDPEARTGSSNWTMGRSSCSKLGRALNRRCSWPEMAAAAGTHVRNSSHYTERAAAEEGFAESDYDLTCLTLGRRGAVSPSPGSPPPPPPPLSGSRVMGAFTRTCKLCGTSKTPLWRSGPMGAKSLCNACGIRSNKAKKLSAAAHEDNEEQGGDGGTGVGSSSWTAGKPNGFVLHAASCKSAMKRKRVDITDQRAEVKKKVKTNVWASDGVLEADNHVVEEEEEKKKQRSSVFVWRKQQQEKALPRLELKNVSMDRTVPSASSPVKTESSSCVTTSGTPSPCSTRRPLCGMTEMEMELSHGWWRQLDSICCRRDEGGAFPKEEEQAAFLLMALSCGLVLA